AMTETDHLQAGEDCVPDLTYLARSDCSCLKTPRCIMLFEGGALMVRRWPIPAALFALLLVAARAGGTQSLNLAIDEGETGGSDIKPGETLTLGLTIKHTRMSNPFSLPRTPGLVVNG